MRLHADNLREVLVRKLGVWCVGVRQTGRMFELLGQGQGLLTLLLGIAQAPEKLGH